MEATNSGTVSPSAVQGEGNNGPRVQNASPLVDVVFRILENAPSLLEGLDCQQLRNRHIAGVSTDNDRALLDFLGSMVVSSTPAAPYEDLLSACAAQGLSNGRLLQRYLKRFEMLVCTGEGRHWFIMYTGATPFVGTPSLAPYLRGCMLSFTKSNVRQAGQSVINIVSKPFTKFFDVPTSVSLAAVVEFVGGVSCEMREKMDGFIVKAILLAGEIVWQSQKSVLVPGSRLHGFVMDAMGNTGVMPEGMEAGITYIFEVLHPEADLTVRSRVASMFLIGVISGDYRMQNPEAHAVKLRCPRPRRMKTPTSIEEAYAIVNSEDGTLCEGAVLSVLDADEAPLFLMKVKNSDWNAKYRLGKLGLSAVCHRALAVLLAWHAGHPIDDEPSLDVYRSVLGSDISAHIEGLIEGMVSALLSLMDTIRGQVATGTFSDSDPACDTSVVQSIRENFPNKLCSAVKRVLEKVKHLLNPSDGIFDAAVCTEVRAELCAVLFDQCNLEKRPLNIGPVKKMYVSLGGMRVLSPTIRYPARCGMSFSPLVDSSLLGGCLFLARLARDTNELAQYACPERPRIDMDSVEVLRAHLRSRGIESRVFGSAAILPEIAGDVDVVVSAAVQDVESALRECNAVDQATISRRCGSHPHIALRTCSGTSVDIVYGAEEWTAMDANTVVRHYFLADPVVRRGCIRFALIAKAAKLLGCSFEAHIVFIAACRSLGVVPAMRQDTTIAKMKTSLGRDIYFYRNQRVRAPARDAARVVSCDTDLLRIVIERVLAALTGEVPSVFHVADERGIFKEPRADGIQWAAEGNNAAVLEVLRQQVAGCTMGVVVDFDETLLAEDGARNTELLGVLRRLSENPQVIVVLMTGRLQTDNDDVVCLLQEESLGHIPLLALPSLTGRTSVLFKTCMLRYLLVRGLLGSGPVTHIDDSTAIATNVQQLRKEGYPISSIIVSRVDTAFKGHWYAHTRGEPGNILRVTIPGPPGVGKSVLMQRMASLLREQGFWAAILSNDELTRRVGRNNISAALREESDLNVATAMERGLPCVLLYDNTGSLDFMLTSQNWLVLQICAADAETTKSTCRGVAIAGLLERPRHPTCPCSVVQTAGEPDGLSWGDKWESIRTGLGTVIQRIDDGRYAAGTKVCAKAAAVGFKVKPLTYFERCLDPHEEKAVRECSHLLSRLERKTTFDTWSAQQKCEHLRNLHSTFLHPDNLHSTVIAATAAEEAVKLIVDEMEIQNVLPGMEEAELFGSIVAVCVDLEEALCSLPGAVGDFPLHKYGVDSTGTEGTGVHLRRAARCCSLVTRPRWTVKDVEVAAPMLNTWMEVPFSVTGIFTREQKLLATLRPLDEDVVRSVEALGCDPCVQVTLGSCGLAEDRDDFSMTTSDLPPVHTLIMQQPTSSDTPPTTTPSAQEVPKKLTNKQVAPAFAQWLVDREVVDFSPDVRQEMMREFVASCGIDASSQKVTKQMAIGWKKAQSRNR